MTAPRFFGLLLQLGLILGTIQVFRLEELHGLTRILPVIGIGFAVHAWLPRRLQLPWFLMLSFGGLLLVLGVEAGLQAIGIGLGLIALCHLPAPRWARLAAVLAAGAGLAALRVFGSEPWTAKIFPILASMFMFRLIVYLYDTGHERTPSSPWQRVAYFFLLPNVCLPLFPIVDYATFRRTWFDAEPVRIYQKGLHWMLRGVSHLLVYRVIYQHWTPAPEEVTDLPELLQLMIASYCQILRISGQFHLAVGTLCLFGFDLPRTQHLYFLSSSFVDYWRRANIYWRDFMVKIFLYPAFVRLRRRDVRQPMFLATLFVFASSWVLHSYQWFWLLGSFPVKLVDVVFWGVFGLAVAGNAVWESRNRRARAAAPPGWPRSIQHALQIVGVFWFVCGLWSFWTAESIGAWLDLVARARQVSPAQALAIAALGAGVVAALAAFHRASQRPQPWLPSPSPAQTGWLTAAAAGVLFALGTPAVQAGLGPRASEWLAETSNPDLNRVDRERFVAGYYAELQGAHRLGSPLWDWEGLKAQEEIAPGDFLRIQVDEPILWRGRPGIERMQAGEYGISTNRWGMRDRDYEREPPPGTYRIAIHGASPEMGFGVRDEEVFERLIEERLNRDYAGRHFERYEVLNFAVGGHRPLDYLYMLETTSLAFHPNAVVYIAHDIEVKRLVTNIHMWLERGYEPDGRVGAVVRAAGVTPGMTKTQVHFRLMPRREELLLEFYREFAEAARAAGAVPVWAFVRMPTHPRKLHGLPIEAAVAREAGFVTLVMHDLFDPERRSEFEVSRADRHPNALGHAMIAEALFEQMRHHDAELGLGLGDGAPEPPGGR